MPIEPSNPQLQRTALRAAAEPPSRYLFRSIHTRAAPYQRSLATTLALSHHLKQSFRSLFLPKFDNKPGCKPLK